MDELCDGLATDLDGSFGELMELLGPPVYSGLRRLYPDVAEDLLQEAFIRAYQALSGYDANRIRALALRGWIWTIALNLGRNHRVTDRDVPGRWSCSTPTRPWTPNQSILSCGTGGSPR